jgi:hypothetical protein
VGPGKTSVRTLSPIACACHICGVVLPAQIWHAHARLLAHAISVVLSACRQGPRAPRRAEEQVLELV